MFWLRPPSHIPCGHRIGGVTSSKARSGCATGAFELSQEQLHIADTQIESLQQDKQVSFFRAAKFFSRAHRQAKMREIAFRALRHLTPHLKSVVIEDVSGRLIVANAADNFITFECVKHGQYLTSPIHCAMQRYKDLGFPSGRVFLEIGANIGTETVAALKSGLFSRAVAVEPEPNNVLLLRMAAVANEMADRIDILPCLASSQAGTVMLTKSQKNAGDHKIAEPADAENAELIVVESKTVDQLLSELKIAPAEVGMLFVDVQGHEPEVLAGADHLLALRVPIVMEFTRTAMAEAGKMERLQKAIRNYNSFEVLRAQTAEGPFPIAKLPYLDIGQQEHADILIY